MCAIRCGVGAVQVAVGEAAWVAGPPVVALVGCGVARPQVVVLVTVAPDGLFAVVVRYVDKDAGVLKCVAIHVEQLVAATACAALVVEAVVGHRAAVVSGVRVWCGLAPGLPKVQALPLHAYPEGGGVAEAGGVDAAPGASTVEAYQVRGGDAAPVAGSVCAVRGRRCAEALLVSVVVV